MSLYESYKNYTQEQFEKAITDLVKYNEDNGEENQDIDYKTNESLDFLKSNSDTAKKHKKDFADDISAFANPNGGIIIYGIKDRQKNKGEIEFDEGIDSTIVNKDRILQIANSNVEPSFSGLDIRYFKHPENNNYIVVMLIPPNSKIGYAVQSKLSSQYHLRLGTGKKQLLDWEIRMRNNQIAHPQLKFDINLGESYFALTDEIQGFQVYLKNPKIENIGKIIANKTFICIKCPIKLSFFRTKISKYIFRDDYFCNCFKYYDYPIYPNLSAPIYDDSMAGNYNLGFVIQIKEFLIYQFL